MSRRNDDGGSMVRDRSTREEREEYEQWNSEHFAEPAFEEWLHESGHAERMSDEEYPYPTSNIDAEREREQERFERARHPSDGYDDEPEEEEEEEETPDEDTDRTIEEEVRIVGANDPGLPPGVIGARILIDKSLTRGAEWVPYTATFHHDLTVTLTR